MRTRDEAIANIGVYGVLCKANGKWYVGQSRNLCNRKRSHLTALANGNHYNKAMLADAMQHGAACFEFHVLSVVRPDDLLHEETLWIQRKNSTHSEHGYNIIESYQHANRDDVFGTDANRSGRHFFKGIPVLVDFETFERNLRMVS